MTVLPAGLGSPSLRVTHSPAPPLVEGSVPIAFAARHRHDGKLWVLELFGEADWRTRRRLRAELGHAFTGLPRALVVDVAHLDFCDGGSAGLILDAARRTGLVLVGADGIVERVFDCLDPGHTMRHCATLAEVKVACQPA